MSVQQTDRHRDLYAGWGPLGDYLSLALEDLADQEEGARLEWEDRARLQRFADLMESAVRGAEATVHGREGLLRARKEARHLAADEGGTSDLPPFDADIAHYDLLVKIYPSKELAGEAMVADLGDLSKLVKELGDVGQIPEDSAATVKTKLIPMMIELAHVYDGAEEELPSRERAGATAA